MLLEPRLPPFFGPISCLSAGLPVFFELAWPPTPAVLSAPQLTLQLPEEGSREDAFGGAAQFAGCASHADQPPQPWVCAIYRPHVFRVAPVRQRAGRQSHSARSAWAHAEFVSTKSPSRHSASSPRSLTRSAEPRFSIIQSLTIQNKPVQIRQNGLSAYLYQI